MISDFEIVEYVNPLFPNRQMYKCEVGNFEFHANDYAQMLDIVYEAIAKLDNKEYQVVKDKSITSFFEGTTTSKD